MKENGFNNFSVKITNLMILVVGTFAAVNNVQHANADNSNGDGE